MNQLVDVVYIIASTLLDVFTVLWIVAHSKVSYRKKEQENENGLSDWKNSDSDSGN